MTVTAIVGLQFGDEGKGKIAHLLSYNADLVVRSQGGANAGHTVRIGDAVYKWSVLPAGAMSARATALGSAVVVDLGVLLNEMEVLRRCNPNAKLYISCQAHLVLDVHKEMDSWEESLRGDQAIGTTRQGIGPAYEDKCARRGVRVADALDEALLRERLSTLLEVKRRLGLQNTDLEKNISTVSSSIDKIRKHVCHVPRVIQDTIKSGGNVVLEGAHGTLLDLDFGTYPFVTSSNTIASGLCTGAGIGPGLVDEVVGIAKAYMTRVGAGPFPTEMDPKMAAELREKAREYGTRTGRPRRVGWLDLFATKYAADLNGATQIVLTKIDVLGGVDNLKVCVGYELDGEEIDYFPMTSKELANCRPIYEELRGWPDIGPEGWRNLALRGKSELPGEVLDFVRFVERYVGARVSMLSVGGEVRDTLTL